VDVSGERARTESAALRRYDSGKCVSDSAVTSCGQLIIAVTAIDRTNSLNEGPISDTIAW